MKNYLLEVGTENLPVSFQTSAEIQLKEAVAKKLEEERLSFKEIITYSTPRRLAIIINNLEDKQQDEVKEAKGPPANVAFKDGKPTKAAEGFAKRCNINVDQLKIQKYDDIEYIVAIVEQKGKKVEEILPEILPELVLSLRGSHFMRWEDLDVRFQRPIRWITSILDSESLPVTIADVTSTKSSHGHRFLNPDPVNISSPKDYKDTLRKAFVLVDPAERRTRIAEQIEVLAKEKGGRIVKNDSLLDLVNNIVEWPVSSIGEFEKEYLSIPKEVITTVMSSHQKYFPVFKSDENELLNYFICINNKNGASAANIIKGNQRVLKARLEDGAFYYNEDRKHTLADRIEDLKGVTFQKGLGSMYEKTSRLMALSADIADQMQLSKAEKKNAERAAQLCKADLTTFMVREFTELEGIIGRVYALDNNESPEVAVGIGEHYLPRSAEDNIPESKTGKVIAMADKIDTVLSVFSIGKSPTGSADPLGLRRAALGLILTVIKSGIKLNITDLLKKDYDLLGDIKRNEASQVLSQVQEFIIQRLKVYLNDQGYRYDVVDAVLNSKDPLLDILDVIERIKALSQLVKEDNFTPLHESANRVLRLLKKVDQDFVVDQSLLLHDSEKAFYEAMSSINTDQISYEDLASKLKDLTPVVEKFFDDVLVMDKDENVKRNRLSLVNKADQIYKTLADFSYVVD